MTWGEVYAVLEAIYNYFIEVLIELLSS